MNDAPRRGALIRHPWRLAIALIAVHLTLAWFARTPGIFADQAVYISLSRAIREFHYRELFRVDLPLHRMYPPAYPGLLAIWTTIGGEHPDWLVLASLACSAAALLLFFAAVHHLWGSPVSVAALLALAVNTAVVRSGGWVMAEAPFLLFQSLTLWAVSSGAQRPAAPLLAGGAAVAAAMTRSAGVTLVAALGVYWLWQRHDRRAALLAALALVMVGGWLAFTAATPEQVPRSSYLADAVVRPRGMSTIDVVADRLSRNASYGEHLYEQLPSPPLPGTVAERWIGIPAVLTVAAIGFPVMWRRWPAAAIYLAFHLTLLMLWPWALARFLTPLLPWLVLCALPGAGTVAARFSPGWRTAMITLAATCLFFTGTVKTIHYASQRGVCGPARAGTDAPCMYPTWADFFTVAGHVRQHVPPESVFVAGAGATLYLATGHRVVSLPSALAQSPGEFITFLRTRGVDYVMLSAVVPFNDGSPPVGGTPRGRMVSANCTELRLAASSATAYLFRVAAHGEAPAGPAACDAASKFVARGDSRPRESGAN